MWSLAARPKAMLGVLLSTEGPQGKKNFGKTIQKLGEVTSSLGLSPRDEAQ
jgi:hypothetical protein